MRRRLISFLLVSLLMFCFESGYGFGMVSLGAPDSVLLGHSFIDILYRDGIMWMASGSGLNKSIDQGQTWVTYTKESGLNSNDPSAIYAQPGRIWAATSHSQMYEGVNYFFGDGLNYSEDNGDTWQSVTPDEASSFAQLAYDITGIDSGIFAACFYGGLIVSYDLGETWRHIFYSAADSLDWAADVWPNLETGRYYACVADTFHGDTSVLYAGTAGGIEGFYYLPKRDKLAGNSIYDIVGTDTILYIASDGGVTRANTDFEYFFTADTTNGLGTNLIEELALSPGKVWAGAFQPEGGDGAGLYFSTDDAVSWSRLPVDFFTGAHAGVFDFKVFDDTTFYIAAGDNGVFRSVDGGESWSCFFVDSSDVDLSSLRNRVYSLDLTNDTIYLGTKAGLVKASYVAPFEIDYDTLITFPETDSTGSFVSLVRHVFFVDTLIDGVDTVYVPRSFTWLGVEPIDPQPGATGYAAILLDTIVGVSVMSSGYAINDIYASRELTVIATMNNLIQSINNPDPGSLTAYVVQDLSSGLTMEPSYPFFTVAAINGRIYTGSNVGMAYRRNDTNWSIARANTDPHRHDLAVLRRHQNSGLPGDWVVALDLQVSHNDTVLWAACRPVPESTNQVNALAFSTDFGTTWTEVLPNIRVWNMAFDTSGTAYAAATEGLYYAPPPWDSWSRADLIDPITQDTIISETPIYSAEVVDSVLWVGTGLGLAKRNIITSGDWDITRVFKATESKSDVFAAPVPYSPINFNGRLSIHYRVERSADVTVQIYDFAMNLVKTIAEDRPRAGGADYFETWDGYNGAGDMVATGIYFFKVSYSTGEEYWGRLAIIP